jgi:hypothetical protein
VHAEELYDLLALGLGGAQVRLPGLLVVDVAETTIAAVSTHHFPFSPLKTPWKPNPALL